MEFKITKEQIIIALSFFGLGSGAGALLQKKYDDYNTPEEKIIRMKEEEERLRMRKLDSEEAAEKARKANAEAEGARALVKEERHKLQQTKLAYQNEITPAIEAKIRKELQEYISQADGVYAKAKEERSKTEQLRKEIEHEKELANLKLELAKTLKENLTTTEREVKVIYKNSNDDEEKDEE